MAELRYFTTSGRERWFQFLISLKENPSASLPHELLGGNEYTLRAPYSGEIPDRVFLTKIELAESLKPIVDALHERRFPGDRWPGLWDWLAAIYFNSICPPGSDGKRKLRELSRYFYSDDYKRKYRHRIFGPVDLFGRLGPSASLLLHGAPSNLTDWEEQTASRYQISKNPGIAKALFMLYWDEATSSPKRGAAPNSRKPGTLRRFGDLIQQLDRTYDLLSVDSEAIISLLPKEFDRFRPA